MKRQFLGHVRTVLAAAGVAAAAGTWTAVAELSPTRRRFARVAIAAAVVVWPSRPSASADRGRTAAPSVPRAAELSRARRVGVVTLGLTLVGAGVGGRRWLERRWLRRLEQRGHVHPHRALGLRIALLAFVVELSGRVTRTR